MKPSLVACITTWTLLFTACSDDGGGNECIAPEPAPETSVNEALADLDGLPFDDFLDASYEAILRRSPESVSIRGLSEALELRNDVLDDVSDEYVLRTMDLLEGIRTRLRAYDRDALTPAQQLSRDTYDWYLGDQLRRREFLYYDYNILVAAYGQLYFTLTLHSIEDLPDAEDYVARLRHVSRQIEQVRDKLAVRARQGIIAPRILLESAVREAEYVARASARELPLYTHLDNALAALPDVSTARRQDLLAAAGDAIACHVLPSFDALSEDLRRLLAMAPPGNGAEQYEGGVDFYAAELAHHTTTEMTATEVHELGLAVLPGLHAAMRARFDTLGFPQDEPLQQLYERLAEDTGVLYGADAVAGYEALIAQAESRLDQAFVERPAAELVVIGVGSGSYYVDPALDGSRPGAFYAGIGSGAPRYGMPTLTYHEAIPGHHLQISFAQTLDLPDFRRDVSFTAYVEGWALYSEELAAELGWYEGDIAGDLGRLQDAALRAARLVVDTGIHAFGWSFEQSVAFMVENIGAPTPDMEAQVYRYISQPGQATAYWIGKQRILDLRQEVVDALGPAYDLKAFHTAVLASGALPLDVLSTSIRAYIDAAVQPPATLAGHAPELGHMNDIEQRPWRPASLASGRTTRDLLDCATGAVPGCGLVPLLRADAVPARIP